MCDPDGKVLVDTFAQTKQGAERKARRIHGDAVLENCQAVRVMIDRIPRLSWRDINIYRVQSEEA
jgi:hypothetical protein